MVVFLMFFFFGHVVAKGLPASTVWLDKACINQVELDEKQLAIAALPDFLKQSSRVLVLWDETYFSRLWCNLATRTVCKHTVSLLKLPKHAALETLGLMGPGNGNFCEEPFQSWRNTNIEQLGGCVASVQLAVRISAFFPVIHFCACVSAPDPEKQMTSLKTLAPSICRMR